MNDFYFKLSHTALGQNIVQALNLPQPTVLKRTPDISMSMPKGTYLVAASAHSFALNSTLTALESSASIDITL